MPMGGVPMQSQGGMRSMPHYGAGMQPRGAMGFTQPIHGPGGYQQAQQLPVRGPQQSSNVLGDGQEVVTCHLRAMVLCMIFGTLWSFLVFHLPGDVPQSVWIRWWNYWYAWSTDSRLHSTTADGSGASAATPGKCVCGLSHL